MKDNKELKAKRKLKNWGTENRAALKKLDEYKREEAAFMKEENNGNKRSKLKKL